MKTPLALGGLSAVLMLSACTGAESDTMTHDMDAIDDHGHESMTMDDMNTALVGKTGDAFDAAFLEMMIPHHQGAIDMAIAARTSAKHQEIKDMAEAIIQAQQSEIDMMRSWQKEWGYQE